MAGIVAPLVGAFGGASGFGSIVAPVLGAVATSFLSGSSRAQALPAPPSVAQVPEAPTVSSAPDAGSVPVLDQEAARVRAAKRRSESEQRLISLSGESDKLVTLTKSILGDRG